MLVLNCFGTYSQVARIGAVHSKPTKFNDYLILERDYPDASYWDIKIQQRDFDENDSIYVFSDVQTTRMSRSFYKKIDSKYLNDEKYFITVLGYNGDDEIIVEEGPYAICNECQIGFNCQWGCVGSTYAYSLNLGSIGSGSSLVSFADLTPSNGLSPYFYEWVDADDWNYFINNHSYQYYGLSGSFSTGWVNAGKIIQTTGPSGNVYGVRKYIGPWIASNGNLVSNVIAGGESNCGQNFNWAQNTINSNSDNFSNSIPALSCNGETMTPTDVDQPNVFGDIGEMPNEIVSCLEVYFEDFDYQGNLVYSIQYLGNCEGGSVGSGFTWPELVNNFTIFSMTDSTSSPIIISKDSVLNKDGDLVFNGFNTYPGLYYVGLELSDGIYISSYFEKNDTTFQNLTQSNFLNYNPYPNPITSNVYHIDFEATANVEYVYEVKNNLGKSVFSRSYKLDKDETLNDRISLSIPSNYTGMLFNTITFTDGSALQFTMIK